mgnify:CR=1 FL=1
MGRWGTRGPLWGLGAVGRWGDGGVKEMFYPYTPHTPPLREAATRLHTPHTLIMVTNLPMMDGGEGV